MNRGPQIARRGRFTPAVIDEMAALYEADHNMTFTALADRFGASSQHISALLRGRVNSRMGRVRNDGLPRPIRGEPVEVVVTNPRFRDHAETLKRRAAARIALEEDSAVLLYRREKALSIERNREQREAYQQQLADALARISQHEHARSDTQRQRRRNGQRKSKARTRKAA